MGDPCQIHGEKIAVLETRFGSIDLKLDELIVLAKSTNGRVRRLEIWRAYITGGVVFTLTAIGSAFGLVKWMVP